MPRRANRSFSKSGVFITSLLFYVGAALQEQWRRVGVQLEVRPLELATLFADVAKGNVQRTY